MSGDPNLLRPLEHEEQRKQDDSCAGERRYIELNYSMLPLEWRQRPQE
jgi:hypothetical protein